MAHALHLEKTSLQGNNCQSQLKPFYQDGLTCMFTASFHVRNLISDSVKSVKILVFKDIIVTELYKSGIKMHLKQQ